METFSGPERATNEANAIWAQKRRDFQGPPLPIMDFPPIKIIKPI
jgi:hypothetical protein